MFFALWPDDTVRSAIAASTARPLAGMPGRPVPTSNLHMTLAFLPTVSSELLPQLTEIGRRLALPSCRLLLDCWGYFARPRVLWLGPSVVPPALCEFERQLWEALAPLGFVRDHGEFQPHVTVRRKAVAPPSPPPEPVAWPVSEWALVQSRPGARGSLYLPLASWPAAD